MMTRLYSLIILIWFSCFFASPVLSGQTVKATGNGETRSAAIDDAKRNAVEQGVGALISSKTTVRDFQVIEDKIYSRASGYITSYDVVSEEKSRDGAFYTVKINATVQTASIKNDLRAIGILMRQVSNPRFMTLYLPDNNDYTHCSSRGVQNAEKNINDIFSQKGFIILDQSFVKDVYNEIRQAGQIDIHGDELSELALKYHADLLLVFDIRMQSDSDKLSDYFDLIHIDMSLRAVAPATAELISQKMSKTKIKVLKSDAENIYDSSKAVTAVSKLSDNLSNDLIEDTIAYYERASNNGTRFTIWFKGFSEEETYTIVDVIESVSGIMDKNVRNESPGNFQIDVHFRGKKFDFKRGLYNGLKKKGIYFITGQSKGNRFLLLKSEKP